MKKNKHSDAVRAQKATLREMRMDALRDGRKNRSGYIPDERKARDRRACRRGNW